MLIGILLGAFGNALSREAWYRSKQNALGAKLARGMAARNLSIACGVLAGGILVEILIVQKEVFFLVIGLGVATFFFATFLAWLPIADLLRVDKED